MITVKYDVEMPVLSEDWELNTYKESWFYSVYNVGLKNYFLAKTDIDKLPLKQKLCIFNDYVRFLSKNINSEQFKLCHFELRFIVENDADRSLNEHFEIDEPISMLYLKYTLINGKLELFYQFLENINTIKYQEVNY